jgi:hypothetical protein
VTGPLLPERPARELVAWCFYVTHMKAVIVIEPSWTPDGLPGLHLALTARPAIVEETLRSNGWALRARLPRSYGWVARVDLEHQGEGAGL